MVYGTREHFDSTNTQVSKLSGLCLQEEESSDSNKFYPHLMKPMSNRER